VEALAMSSSTIVVAVNAMFLRNLNLHPPDESVGEGSTRNNRPRRPVDDHDHAGR
jgi:hypothetical protein